MNESTKAVAVDETTDNSNANGQDALLTVTATMHGSGSTITGNLNNATFSTPSLQT
jgi:hypothetical protein